MKEEKHSMQQMDMLNGPLLKKILLFALPLAASSLLQQLFNSVDVAVIGRFAGSNALAAVGGNGAVIALLINLFAGISVGANVVIANYIGQGRYGKISETVQTVVWLALISGIILMVLGIFVAKPILHLIDTPDEIIDLAALYLRIYFCGMPFFMVYNFGAAILRSVGDTKRPLYCLLVTGMLNLCLNLLFVIVFQMSVAGVALATTISNGVSAFLIIWILTHRDDMIRLELKRITIQKEQALRMLQIGLPAGVQGMVFSLSNVCIQSAINGFGTAAIAGSAAAVNFEYFSYYVMNAFAQTVVTFTSQNFGAKKYDRCKRVFWLCMACGMIGTAAMSLTFVVTRTMVIRIYTVDEAAIAYALIRMTHVLVFQCLGGSFEISGGALRGMGHSLGPAVMTVFGTCVLRVAWVYFVFPKWNTFGMLLYVYPVTWIITGLLVCGTYFALRGRLFAKNPTHY